MHKFYRSVLLTGMVAVGLAGCGDDVTIVDPPPPPPPPAPTVKSISVAPNPGTVQVGQTITMSAAVNADPGVATTVTWSSADPSRATVHATTGVVTGVAAGSVGITATSTVVPSVQGNATVNVVAAPTATVTGVTVTPGSASLIVGQTVQLSASVSGTNNPAQTVTWSSLSPAIASVSAGGLVTGLANGTAVIRGCSTVTGFTNICGSMSVTVTTPSPATVSLQSLTTGNLATPVNLNSVAGQIEASVNVDAGGQTLSRVDVLIGGVVVASQTFSVSPAPAEGEAAGAPVVVVLSFNTNQLRQVGGMFVPVVFNGQRAVTANLFVVGSSTPIASNAIPVVMNNPDAALAPTVLATDAGAPSFVLAGNTWFRSGLSTSFTYISYSTIAPNAAAVTLSGACGATTNPISGTAAAGITVNATWTCASTEGLRTITGLGAVTYPTGSVGPDGSTLTAATAFSTRGAQYTVAGDARWNVITPATALPAGVRVDNLGPVVNVANTTTNGGLTKSHVAFNAAFDQHWINHAYAFVASTTVGGDVHASDGGSGVATISVRLNSTNCATGPDLGTPHGLSETVTSTSTDGYRICGRSVDNLGNVGFSGPSNWFGVDVVAPSVRLAGSTAATPTIAPSTVPNVSATANTTIYGNPALGSPNALFPTTGVWGLEALDTRSGFNQNAVAGFPAVQAITNHAGTAITCGFTNPIGILLSDTWVRTNVLAAMDCGLSGTSTPSYYWYTGRVIDRAGNTSTTIPRNYVIDQYARPNITGLGFAAALYTPGTAAPFGFSANDDLEIIDATVAVNQNNPVGAAQWLRYPLGSMTALGTRWDGTLTNVLNGATASIPYFIFRIDAMCSAAGVPYASCPNPAVPPYNPLSAPYITTSKPTVVAEYNNVAQTAKLPANISANVGDVASQLALTPIVAPMLTTQFSPSAGIAAPWGAADLISWNASVIGANAVAVHVASTSIVVPYFDSAILVRLADSNLDAAITAADEWVVCGTFPAPVLTDNGAHRFWTYTMTVPTTGPCTGATFGAPGGAYRAIGLKGGAALQTPNF
jgi:hypothetical protein